MKNIKILGARQNNLKNIDIDIPRNQIVVFTGVSGSGKSSLVFETINAEAQRQLNETFSTFIQGKLPKTPKPDCDLIENISPAIVLKQKRTAGSSRSTVGTTTEIYTYLRLLFSRIGEPFIGPSTCFSFDSPEGMCTTCNGTGHIMSINIDKILDASKSLNDNAILFPDFKTGSWHWKYIANTDFFDKDLPINQYSPELLEKFLYGKEANINIGGDDLELIIQYEGLITKINRLYVHKSQESVSKKRRALLEKFMSIVDCDVCEGSRLNKAAMQVNVAEHTINDVIHFQIDRLSAFMNKINDKRAETIIEQIRKKTAYLVEIGLGYLSLSREVSTLSGGEAQRIKLAKQLGSSLTEMLYILDEPSVGLHPRDVHQLNNLLTILRDKGNSILVVEHDPDVIAIADHIIDVGPEAGVNGGHIVYQGSYADIKNHDCETGKLLNKKAAIKDNVAHSDNYYLIENANSNNLKKVTVKIPKGICTCITGVAGSGKSSLIHQAFLKTHPESIVVDQSAIGQSERSNTATYTGLFDEIRQIFATANKVNASLFSFNAKGACETCNGLGYIETEMAFLDPVKTVCETCEGKRYQQSVLAYQYNNLSIVDVLALSVDEAIDVFSENQKILKRMKLLQKVGVGYLTLGQPLSSLSGGECQRIKLSSELYKTGNIYILDEPTTGLHMSDCLKIIGIIESLSKQGNTVIVIEHNLDVIARADWIIDIGPNGGSEGGEVIFEGTPSDLMHAKNSYTGDFLSRYVQRNQSQ